jgi:hypothetical protein
MLMNEADTFTTSYRCLPSDSKDAEVKYFSIDFVDARKSIVIDGIVLKSY